MLWTTIFSTEFMSNTENEVFFFLLSDVIVARQVYNIILVMEMAVILCFQNFFLQFDLFQFNISPPLLSSQ